jgi:rhodanese-related sulfurtransferase
MSHKHVDVKTAHALQFDEDYTYIDVRSISEFESGHPVGARNVPLLNLDRQTGQMRPNAEFLAVMRVNYPLESKLLIGCQTGGRSAQAGQILVTAGYQSIVNVVGGFGGTQDRITGQVIGGWVDAALPVECDTSPEHEYQVLRKKASGDGLDE